MQRRNFLQILSALPLLGWLKPEVDPGVPYCGPVDPAEFIQRYDIWIKRPDGTYTLHSYMGESCCVAELPFHVMEMPDYPYRFIS